MSSTTVELEFYMVDLNLISSYAYDLPEELIAQSPAEKRDQSRLLVFNRNTGERTHAHFFNLLEYLQPNDCLVVNRTKVVPARLRGVRDQTGGKWEGLFLGIDSEQTWEIIGKTRGKLQPGETITVVNDDGSNRIQLKLIARKDEGRWQVRPLQSEEDPRTHWEILDAIGSVPLPPYIQHGHAQAEDRERYQTVYANQPGAAAAPTAGLHFTPELLEQCRQKGVTIAEVTLHVGLGTFRPIGVEKLDEHTMHAEWCEVQEETVQQIQHCRENNGRVIAVGTTTVRTLETASQSGTLQPWQGESTLFIRPGFKFHAVDVLITNFHLPHSTLLVMLSAFAGYEEIMETYRIAVEERYRFFSYGDAMLIL
ncbi:tRNA preQ1(34) S-adenosylmethionine ribosyltransferase-isomerase QueA [Rubinisphaera italica]|uniref:S-adenosylmethionine:tRNA ribosyltransferase-isomerase n=1 Tax=Rubinisphaera italica TaxID=2527969 RepID=A0A5C5XFR2_9PLAN|nr:tRNA preQ1(34) S-adenosylmethionine ribosyltransferase-isomerase QueA [Rubinisphaera italica]TWT61830.1 S-adenosylmethionine:tRNA ribosyltransferase-isomerase [Rubinisphaera italica]